MSYGKFPSKKNALESSAKCISRKTCNLGIGYFYLRWMASNIRTCPEGFCPVITDRSPTNLWKGEGVFGPWPPAL